MLFTPLLLAAAASPPLEGDAAQAIAVTQSSAGAVEVQGAKSKTIAVTASAAGAVAITGAKAKTIAVALSGAGSVPALGALSKQIVVTQAAGTLVSIQGEATQSITVSQNHTGEIEVVKATTLTNARILRENLVSWHQFGVASEIKTLAERYFFGFSQGQASLSQIIGVGLTGEGAVAVTGTAAKTIAVTGLATAETGGVAGGGQGQAAAASFPTDRVLRPRLVAVHEFGQNDPSLSALLREYFFGAAEGVSGAQSRTIAVTQSAAGSAAAPSVGTLNKQIVVSQDARSGALFAAGPNTRLIQIGDSIFQLGLNHFIAGGGPAGTANHFSRQGNGEIQWAFMKRPGFRYANWGDLNASNPHPPAPNPLFRGANCALSSTWATYYRYLRMAEPLNIEAEICVLNLGTNNGTAVPPYYNQGDTDSAHVIQMLSDMVGMLRARGTVVVLGTIRPRVVTPTTISSELTINPARRAYIDAVNAAVRGMHNPPGVWVWDSDPDLLDPNPTETTQGQAWQPGSIYPWATVDHVHLNPRGAYASGYHSLADVLTEIVGPGTWFDADPFTANLITNGGLTGSTSSAIVGSQLTGVGPTNWTATHGGGTIVTAVCSLEANAETGGQSWIIDVTTAGGSSSSQNIQVVRASPTALNLTSLGLQPTDYVQFWLEVEVEANAAGVIGRLGFEVLTNTVGPWGGLSNKVYRGMGEHRANRAETPWPNEAYSGWIESEPIIVGSNTTFTPRVLIEGRIDISSGLSLAERTCRVKIKRMIARTVEDPHIAFPFEARATMETPEIIQIGQASSGIIGASSSVSGSANQPILVTQGAQATTPASQGRGRFPLNSDRVTREALVKNHVHGNNGTVAAQVTGDYFFGYQKPKGVLRQTLGVSLGSAGLVGKVGSASQAILVTLSAVAASGAGEGALIDGVGDTLIDASGAFLEASGINAGTLEKVIPVTQVVTGELGSTQSGGLVDDSGAFLTDANGDFLMADQAALGDASQLIVVGRSAAGVLPVTGAAARSIGVTQTTSGELGAVDGQIIDFTGAYLTDDSGAYLAEVLGILSEATQPITVGLGAAGLVQDVIHGDYAKTIAVTPASTGAVAIVGAASQPILVEQIASQTVTVAGRYTNRIEVTQTGEGVAPVLGTATQPISVVQAADGLAPALGLASQAITVTQDASGLTVFYQAAASQVITVGQAASGLTVFYQGAANQPIAVTQSAVATNPVLGAAAQPVGITQIATALAFTQGAANQNIGIVQTAAGGVTDVTQPSVVSGIAHLLNATASVFRNTPVSDGKGGWTESLVLVGTVACRISSPSGKDAQIAALRQAVVTHAVYMGSEADIRYGDMLQINGTWHFVQVPDLRPSIREHHLKILTEERQRRAA